MGLWIPKEKGRMRVGIPWWECGFQGMRTPGKERDEGSLLFPPNPCLHPKVFPFPVFPLFPDPKFHINPQIPLPILRCLSHGRTEKRGKSGEFYSHVGKIRKSGIALGNGPTPFPNLRSFPAFPKNPWVWIIPMEFPPLLGDNQSSSKPPGSGASHCFSMEMRLLSAPSLNGAAAVLVFLSLPFPYFFSLSPIPIFSRPRSCRCSRPGAAASGFFQVFFSGASGLKVSQKNPDGNQMIPKIPPRRIQVLYP